MTNGLTELKEDGIKLYMSADGAEGTFAEVTEVVIPAGVNVKEYTFYNCSSIQKVTIEEGVENIGEYAFHGCNNLVEAVFGDNIKSIGENAFTNCATLKQITIGNSITSFSENAFDGCALEWVIYTKTVEDWCNLDFVALTANPMYYAENIEIDGETVVDLVIPETVTEIKDNAFYNFRTLKTVVVPNTVTKIGAGAFAGCVSLENMTLPFVGGNV